MHDLWPTIRSGFANVFRFGGHMGRSDFWLWIGFLYVVASILLLLYGQIANGIGLRQPASEDEWYKFMRASPWASMLFDRSMAAWPRGLTLTSEFFYWATSSYTRIAFPLIYMLSLSATVRRARDAGYSPLLTLLMLYWFVLGAALVIAAMFLLGSISEALAWTIGIPGTLYFRVHWAVSLIFAVVALYRLAAPSVPEPESP